MQTWEKTYRHKADIWGKKLGKLPGIGAILLSGSIAQGRAHRGSDIDFFVIAKPGRIWTARFFVYVRLLFAGEMRRGGSESGKICPNHFITTKSLEIREKDEYSASLFSSARPVYDDGGIYAAFVSANAPWLKIYGYTMHIPASKSMHSYVSPGIFGRIVELILRAIQIWKVRRNPDSKLPGAKIVLKPYELRFHPRPKNTLWKKK